MKTNQLASVLIVSQERTGIPSGATKLIQREPHKAFTIIELLVVLVVVAFLVTLLATARAASRPNFLGALCLNNMRQLMAAFTMYTHDNSDFFPPNPDLSGPYTNDYNWVRGDASGWMPAISAGGSPGAGNPDFLTDPVSDLLVNYIRTNISLFHCPFDPRLARYTGSDASRVGTIIPAVRIISINGGVGTHGLVSSTPNFPVDGPWLDGSHSHLANEPYATFGKWRDFAIARPAEIWCFIDDDPWTINDDAMSVIAAMPQFVDYPNVFNNNSTSMSFGDGHAETHKWKSIVFIHNARPGRTTAQPGLQYDDWFWWASHATRNVNTGTVP